MYNIVHVLGIQWVNLIHIYILGYNCHCSINTSNMLCFPCGSDGKESGCNAGDLGSIPGWGRSPGEGKGYLLQYPGLENSMDCIVSCKELDTTEQLSLSCHIIIIPFFVVRKLIFSLLSLMLIIQCWCL